MKISVFWNNASCEFIAAEVSDMSLLLPNAG
jgi:hypothetical protein